MQAAATSGTIIQDPHQLLAAMCLQLLQEDHMLSVRFLLQLLVEVQPLQAFPEAGLGLPARVWDQLELDL